jgi:tetratricopeptide (TPR) repeat protein
VLEAALAANSSDATAQFLLGTLLFSKGLYEPGMEHWTDAKRLSPKLPVLDADRGKAWLHLKSDPEHALEAFREGVKNDPTNADIYVGLDEAMSLAGVSANERSAALGSYPSTTTDTVPVSMPANLTYQLALTRAEAGQFEQALALFKDRFFPSEEGGVSTEQVLFEIKLMKAEAAAAAGHCTNVAALADEPGLAVNGAVAQAYVRMAAIAKTCQQPEQTKALLQKAANSKDSSDVAWVAKAEKLLGTYDASRQEQKLEGLASAETSVDTSGLTGWSWYNIGTIQAALHHPDQAKDAFHKALLLPDSWMSHHYSRAAMADSE